MMTTIKQDNAYSAPVERRVMRDGYDRLWLWFGLSRASWLTLPRVLMHDMPDEWQEKMAALLEEWDETWDSSQMPEPHVSAKQGNKFVKWPDWLLCYKRPDKNNIDSLRTTNKDSLSVDAKLSRAGSALNETADG